jgi:hypothetical protein
MKTYSRLVACVHASFRSWSSSVEWICLAVASLFGSCFGNVQYFCSRVTGLISETNAFCSGWKLVLSRFAWSLVVALFMAPMLLLGESEPNDVLGDSNVLPLNGQMSGQIQSPGEYDWYRITCPDPGRLELRSVNPSSNLRVEMAMFGRHAQWISVYRSAVNLGDDVFLSLDIVEPGTYFVRFRDMNNAASGGDYTLFNTFTPVMDPNEPNGDLGYATLVDSRSMRGMIFSGNDYDFFRLYVEENSTVGFTLESPDAMRGELALYDEHYGWMSVYTSAVNDGDTVFLEHQVNHSAFYYLRVRDVHGRSHLDAYSLAVSGGRVGFVPAESPATTEKESNDDSGHANLIGIQQTVSGTIGDAGDMDWFAFDVTGPNQMTLSMDTSSDEFLLSAEFFNPSKGHLLTGQSGHPGDPFSMTYDFLQPGRYLLRVRSLNNAFNDTPYRFSTSVFPVIDPYEPNGDYGDATPLSQINQLKGFLFPTGDHDWFRVQVAEPGTLTAIVSGLPSNITPSIDFFNLSKEHRAGRSGAAGVDLRVSYEVGEPGTCLVRMRDNGDNDESTQPYTLTLLGASFESYAPVARIQSIDPGAIVVGDEISFEGVGSDIDGSISGYEWRSSIDGVLSDQATFRTDSLSVGTHDIYFRVLDNQGIWSTQVGELVYVGSSISEEIEPNGSFFEANEFALERPLTGKVEERGENDFYKVYVPGAGHLRVELTNVPVDLRMELALFNRYWDWVSVSNMATEAGDDVGVSMDITEPGLVYVRLRDVQSVTNADFTYTLAAYFEAAPDVFEPNGSLLQAPVLPSAQVEAYFFPSGDYDWYRVWVEQGQTLVAEVNALPSNVRAEVALYGRNREWLSRYQSSTNPGDSVVQQIDATQSGFYFIRVRAMDGRNWTNTYKLNVSGGMPGFVATLIPVQEETESNNDIADSNLVSLGNVVSGSMEQRNDEDWFAFDLPSPGLLEVSVDQLPADMRGRVQLFQDDRSHVATRQATNAGDPLLMEVRMTVPGRYYVRVDHVGGDFSTPRPYVLGLSSTPIVDVYEPNHEFQDATLITQQNRVQGYMFDVGDFDWYRVRTQEGNTLRITVGDVPSEIRPQIELFDFHEGHKATKRATNEGQSITLEYVVPATGEYSIRIRDVGDNNFSASPYTLLIDGATFESYVPMAFIDEMIPNPAGEGEMVQFVGHGEDADGSIIGYEWRSSVDGVFSISQNATSEGLSTGVHEIFFKVKDNHQNWSPETSEILFLGVPAPQEEEPNDIAGSATLMELDRQYKGRIDRNGDYDWYRIPVTGPGTLVLQLVNPSDVKMRAELAMYSPDLGWAGVSTTADNEGDSLTLRWDLNEAADYFLRLRDVHNRVDAEYTLSAHVDLVPDPFEPNHNFTTASPIGTDDVLEAYIYPRDDHDWYEVTFETPGTFHASLTSVPESMRIEIAMYGPDLNWLSVYSSGGNPGDNVFRDYDVSQPGTYFLRVRDTASTRNTEDTYTLTTSFEPVVDVFEPNHDWWHASRITQSPVQAYIFPGGDYDHYRLYAPGGGPLDVSIEQAPSHMRMELALYDTHYNWMSVYKSAAAEGDPVALHLDEASGYYYLRVREVDHDRSPVEPYQLSIQGAVLDHVTSTEPMETETEPNDRFAFATVIQMGEVTGLYQGNEDWFQFEVTTPGELAVELLSPETNRAQLNLYDRNAQHLIGRDSENKGDPSRLVYPISRPGWYALRVLDADGATSHEPYQLSVVLHPDPDTHEPNPSYSTAEPLALNVPAVGNIFPTGDQDWYQFETTETGTVQFTVLNESTHVQTSLYVYNEELVQLLRYDALHIQQPVETSLWLETPGLYWVRITDRADNAYSLQSYTLTARFAPEVDVFEPNDRFRDATDIAEINQIKAIIYPANDWDWYRFDVAEAGRIRLQVSQPGGIQPDIRLYDDSASQLARVAARNTGETVLLVYDISIPDTYYVAVRDDDEARVSTEPYVLTLEGVATLHSAPMAEPQFDLSPNPVRVGHPVTLSGEGSAIGGSIVDYEWTSNLDGVLGRSASLTVQELQQGIHSIGLRVRDSQGTWSGRVDHNLVVASDIWSESEYNNSWETAYSIPLNTWVTGHIAPRGEYDFYQIYVEQCGLLRILLNAVPYNLRPEIAMLGPKGEWLGISSLPPNAGEWADVAWYATPGYYHIRIRDVNNATHVNPYALKAFFDPSGDRFEPNGSFSQATPIGVDQMVENLTICPRDDQDCFRIDATEAGRLTMKVVDPPEGMRSEMAMYNRDFGWMSVYHSAINAGEPIDMSYDITEPGTYFVRVRDLNSRGHTESYAFQTEFTPVVDPYEPNGGHGVATLLKASTVQAYIFRGVDEDWYRVYAQEGSLIRCSASAVPESQRTELALYGVERQWLSVYNQANHSGDTVHLNYTVPRTGFYYLRVRDTNGGSHLAPYTLTVEGDLEYGFEPEFAPVITETEDNSEWSTSNDIALDTMVSGAVESNGDADRYRFWINAPGILQIEHTQVQEAITSEIWVYNPHFNQIAYRTTTNPGEDNLLEVALTEPGWYYLRLADRGNNHSSPDPYQLRLNHTPVVDEHEYNDGLGAATPLGEATIQGYLFSGDDVDWYRAYVREPSTLSVSLVEVSDVNRPRLRIYDSDGAERGNWVNTNAGVTGENVIVYEAVTPGFYYVRVNDEDRRYSADPYSIRIEGADFSRAPSLDAIGDQVIEAMIPYALRVSAKDPDNPEVLVYSATNLPPGARFDPVTRLLEWTPLFNQAGTYSGVTFEVSDGDFSDSESITLTVETHNLAPVLDRVGDRNILEESEFRLTLSAIDPNPGDTLAYSAENLPRDAVFDTDSATFVWTPTANQLGEHGNILFVVTDGVRSDFEYVTLNVVEELEPEDPRDVWWATHFTEAELSDPNVSEMDADPDGDGLTNGQELEADTNPKDPHSLLQIFGFASDGENLEISWRGGRDSIQYLQFRSRWDADSEWQTIHTFEPPTAIENSATDDHLEGMERYYRILAERP